MVYCRYTINENKIVKLLIEHLIWELVELNEPLFKIDVLLV